MLLPSTDLLAVGARQWSTGGHAVAAESLLSLMFPFTWMHTYIPVLPVDMLDCLQSITPFIAGVHASYRHLANPVEDVRPPVYVPPKMSAPRSRGPARLLGSRAIRPCWWTWTPTR